MATHFRTVLSRLGPLVSITHGASAEAGTASTRGVTER